jgi:hypothetical protein
MHRLVRLVLAVGLTLLAAAPLAAQGAKGVQLVVSLVPDPARKAGVLPESRVTGLLQDERWTSALLSGLPLRLHYRLELWRSRGSWFDASIRSLEWDVVVQREPLLDQYAVTTVLLGRTRQQRYPDLTSLGTALGVAYRISVRPDGKGDYYYAATLQVSTLSDADLDEMDRVLRGDPESGDGGSGDLGDAVGRAARRLVLRVAGLPLMRVEGKSATFEVK